MQQDLFLFFALVLSIVVIIELNLIQRATVTVVRLSFNREMKKLQVLERSFVLFSSISQIAYRIRLTVTRILFVL